MHEFANKMHAQQYIQTTTQFSLESDLLFSINSIQKSSGNNTLYIPTYTKASVTRTEHKYG